MITLFIDRVIYVPYYLITHLFYHRINKATGFLIKFKVKTYLVKLSPRLNKAF